MAENVVEENVYGYQDDTATGNANPFVFGLNQKARLTKFEWIPNGGKDGAEGEAIDIIFNINGTDKSYRMFPVTKAFLKDNKGETTDRSTPEFKDALQDFNARITHILHAFVPSEAIKVGFSRPMKNFKEFAQVAMGILPNNYAEIDLDIFLQYQYSLKDTAKRTYLEIPNKMKYGKWLVAHVPGNFTEVRKPDPEERDQVALKYVDAETNQEHPFTKNGWFMRSNLAKQQVNPNFSNQEENVIDSDAAAGSGGNINDTVTNESAAGSGAAAW